MLYSGNLNSEQNISFFDNKILSNIIIIGLISGTFLSYIPQYYRMYKKKSVKETF